MTLAELRKLARSRGYRVRCRDDIYGPRVWTENDAYRSGPDASHPTSRAVAIRMLALGLRAMPRRVKR